MAASNGSGTEAPAVISRRDAIIGALALAAGSIVAARPDIALAVDGGNMITGRDNGTASQTTIARTASGVYDYASAYTVAYLNYYGGIHAAVMGIVGATANDGSSGVRGWSTMTGSYGVSARNSGGGIALSVDGKAAFSRSGKVTIKKGNTGCTVTVTGGLDANSMILATLQGSAGTGVYLRYAKYASATTFTIKLNKTAAVNVAVAWFIVG